MEPDFMMMMMMNLQWKMQKINAKMSLVFLNVFEKHIRPLQSLLYLSPVLPEQNKSGLKLLSSHFTIPQNNFIHSMPLVFLYPQKNP